VAILVTGSRQEHMSLRWRFSTPTAAGLIFHKKILRVLFVDTNILWSFLTKILDVFYPTEELLKLSDWLNEQRKEEGNDVHMLAFEATGVY